jgi:hypothetical protein
LCCSPPQPAQVAPDVQVHGCPLRPCVAPEPAVLHALGTVVRPCKARPRRLHSFTRPPQKDAASVPSPTVAAGHVRAPGVCRALLTAEPFPARPHDDGCRGFFSPPVHSETPTWTAPAVCNLAPPPSLRRLVCSRPVPQQHACALHPAVPRAPSARQLRPLYLLAGARGPSSALQPRLF